MRPLFVPVLILPLLLQAPPAALALTADELSDAIAGWLDELGADMAPGSLSHDPLMILPEGEGFRVTIPGLTLHERDDALRDLVVGDVSFLVAEPAPGDYAFSEVTLPERLALKDLDGQPHGSLGFDLERLSGTWSSGLGELTELDFALNGFDLRVPDEGVVIWLGRASALLETRPSADGFHRQSQDYHLGDLVLSGPEGTLEIAGIQLDGAMEGLDLEAYRTLMAILGDIETAAARGDDSKLGALRAAMARLAESDPVATHGEQRITATGLSASGEQGQALGRLASIGLTASVDAQRGADEGGAALRFEGEGLELDAAGLPDAAPWLGLVPTRWSLPLRLEKLPMQALSEAMVDLIFDMALDPLGGTAKSDLAGRAILNALGTAGSRLIIQDLFVESSLARVVSEAALAFDPGTPLGMVGTTSTTFFGLDRVLALAEGLADPEAKRWLSTAVLFLMGFGEAVAQPDGTVGYRYQFFLTPEGSVTMNGRGIDDWVNKAIPQ